MTNGLRLARWAWVVGAAAMVGLAVTRIGHIWTESRSLGAAPEYFNGEGQYRLSFGQANALQDIGLSPDWHAAFVSIRFVLVVATSLVISMLVWRRARTWAPLFLAWFLLTSMLFTTFSDDGSDGELPGLLGLLVVVLFIGSMISVFGLLLVFPDDSSARWIVGLLLTSSVIPFYAAVTENDAIFDWMWNNGLYIAAVMLGAGLTLQVSRIARTRDRTARDLLLLTVTMIIVFVTFGLSTDWGWTGIDGPRAGLASLAWRLGYETLFMAVPLTYGLAVLRMLVRRGHWDMDVQLKGSVGYAGLTTLLVMGYFGVVAVVQAIVNDVSGAEGNTFALMVSTALIAAAILPLRSRLQHFVDRLFDRRRRDIDRLVSTFETSVVRETNPDDVANSLLNAVEDVFRPEQADVWLLPEAPS